MNIQEFIEKQQHYLGYKKVPVESIDLAPDMSEMDYRGESGPETVRLDEVALKSLADYLDVPWKYVEKCPRSLVKTNFDHWLDEAAESDVEVVLQLYKGELEKFYSTNKVLPNPTTVLQVLSGVWPRAEVLEVQRGPTKTVVDLKLDRGGIRVTIDTGRVDSCKLQLFVGDVRSPVVVSDDSWLVSMKGKSLPELYSEIAGIARKLSPLVDKYRRDFEALSKRYVDDLEEEIDYLLGVAKGSSYAKKAVRSYLVTVAPSRERTYKALLMLVAEVAQYNSTKITTQLQEAAGVVLKELAAGRV